MIQFVDANGNSIASGSSGTPVWSAFLGSVGQDGTYTAPASVPQDGMDTINYIDPNTGITGNIVLNIIPNTGAPVSSTAPQYTMASTTVTATSTSSEAATEASHGPKVSDAEQLPTTVSTVDTPSPAPSGVSGADTPIQLSNIQPVAATTLDSGAVGFQVPANPIQPGLPVLYAVPDPSVTLLTSGCKGALYPARPWAGQACSGSPSTQIVAGPQNTADKITEDGPTPETVTAALKLDAQVFGANVQVGAKFNASFYHDFRSYWQNEDVYVCQGGKWVYSYSRHCTAAQTWTFGYSPSWWVMVMTLQKLDPTKPVPSTPNWACSAL